MICDSGLWKIHICQKNLTINFLLPLQGLLQELRHLKIKVEELENERNQYEWKLKATKVSRNPWEFLTSAGKGYAPLVVNIYFSDIHLVAGQLGSQVFFNHLWHKYLGLKVVYLSLCLLLPPCSFQSGTSCNSYFRKPQKAFGLAKSCWESRPLWRLPGLDLCHGDKPLWDVLASLKRHAVLVGCFPTVEFVFIDMKPKVHD